MRRALKTNKNRQQVSAGASLPAPIKGWDAQSPLAAMKPGNAVTLINWIPRPGYVEMRRGNRQQMVGFTDPVQSLIVWTGGGENMDKMFAVTGGSVYDASSLGSAPGEPDYAGLTSNIVESENFSNDGGVFMLCANGADTPFYYDGTSFAALSITGSSGSIVLDPATLFSLFAHKKRLFWLEGTSLRVWFFPVNAIQGPAQLLDLGPVFTEGGQLIAGGTWSQDGGQGPDDLAVFLTNKGQIAVYQGTDPASATDWALVGVYDVGIPLGRRSLLKYGGDLVALTTLGVVPLSQAVQLNRADQDKVALTSKIENAFAVATQAYGDLFGWQGMFYPRGGLAIYNVPTVEFASSVQYVQDVQSGGWCQFTGMNAICWTLANGNPYFGAVDGVYQYDIGVTDDGEDLTADMTCAFTSYGAPGRLKQFTALRPILRATPNVRPAVAMLIDFNSGVPTAVPTVIDDRSTDLQTRYQWTGVTGVGYYGAPTMRVVTMLESNVNADLAVGDGDVVGDGEGNTIITDSNEPFNAQIQVVGFDVIYQPGGQI
jgi:hypothetical protein